MKSRLPFLLVTAWLALSLEACFEEHPSVVEIRTKAEQGDAEAQNSLGRIYSEGQGVPQDAAEAMKWWRKAAEQENAEAQYNLGLMYHEGENVPKDDVEAYLWCSLAAAHGYKKAKSLVDSIGHDITPDQLAQAQKRVAAWKPKVTIAPPAKKP